MEKFNSLIFQSCLHPTVENPNLSKGFYNPKYLKVLILSFCLFAFALIEAQASHFRYGNISWRVVGPRTIEFKVSQAWRSSAFGATVGASVYTGDFFFGDGSVQNIFLNVTSVNVAQDWFYGEATFNKTYSADGAYTAYFDGCCRISTLQNNADGSFMVETIVQVGRGNNSPVVTLPPIRTLPNDLASATFPIPATDFDGDALTYRLANSAEMAGGVNPVGLSINPTTGFISWSTLGKPDGLYNAAVVITDSKGAKVVIDFLISVQAVPPPPPVFDFTVTPRPASAIEARIGIPVNFNIRATDQPSTDVVTIFALGMPAGAILNPGLATGNPVQTSFSWTPATTGSFVITFVAEDNKGNQTTTSVTINVSNCTLVLTSIPKHVTTIGGSNGAIDLSVSGGTAPYRYNWSNGSTTQDLSGLTAGTYNVTVVDATGSCRQTASIVINTVQACNIMLSTVVTHVSSASGNNGAIDLTVTGGTAPFTYNWSNGSTTQDLTGLVPGTYNVTVVDATGSCRQTASVIIINSNSPSTCTASGFITREQYNAFDPSGAPIVSTLNSFEANNKGDFFVARILGYICPPQTGNYSFWISGDDATRLTLSTDANPANAQLIAYSLSPTNWREYTKYPSQKSVPVYLEAGKKYYIEAQHAEFWAGDHVTVAWQLPNGTMEGPIAGSYLSPYENNGQQQALATSTQTLRMQMREMNAAESITTPKGLMVTPNPFAEKATIDYVPAEAGELQLEVFTTTGKLVRTLYKGQAKAGGVQQYVLDGSGLAVGIYLCRVTLNNKTEYKRILLLR